MSILEEITGKLTSVSELASQKAKEFSETTKVQSLILSEKKKKDGLLLELGQLYYEKYKGNLECEFQDLLSDIAKIE